MKLTHTEQERLAYMNNDPIKADLFARLDEAEDNTELSGIDNALDSVGLSGYRGARLEDALIAMESKISLYEEILKEIKMTRNVPKKVINLIQKIYVE